MYPILVLGFLVVVVLYTMWDNFVELVLRKSAFKRARFFVGRIQPHLKAGNLLDIGTGAGHIAALLSRDGWSVSATDVRAHLLYVGMWLIGAPSARMLARKHSFSLTTYDGERLPYKSQGYDNVTLLFVLHHTPHEIAVLEEASRVMRADGRLIVLEDTPEDSRQGRINALSDALLNAEVHSDGQNRSKEEWRRIFAARGLRIVEEASFDSRMLRFLHFFHTMFVLEKAE